jgi:hypothetical protein
MVKNLVIVLVIVLLGGAVYVVNSPAAKGSLKVYFWDDENEPLQCTKGNLIVLENRTIEHPIDEIIMAGGDCQIKLVNCTFKSPLPIYAEDESQLWVVGGKLEAEEKAIASSGASVKLEGVEIVSGKTGVEATSKVEVVIDGGSIEADVALDAQQEAKVRVNGTILNGRSFAVKANAEVEVAISSDTKYRGEIERQHAAVVSLDGSIENERVRMSDADRLQNKLSTRFEKYSRNVCKGFGRCFMKLGGAAMVNGEIWMPVDKKGRVKTVKLQAAIPEVAQCVRRVGLKKRIAGFKGPPGKLICRFSGMVQPDSDALTYETAYEPTGAAR